MAETDSRDDELADLFRVWRAEWAAALREHAFWRDDPQSAIVEFAGDGAIVSRGNAQAESEIARVPNITELAFALRGQKDVVLRLPQSEVLRANVWLPKAKASTLRQALHFELERLSPVDPSQLYFDFTPIGRDKAANRVELALRIVRRAAVDEALRLCHGAGLAASGVTFAGEARMADAEQFPVDRPAYYRFLWRKWNLAALGGLALVLALAALLAWYGRNQAAQDQLTDQVLVEQSRAAIVSRIQDDTVKTRTRIAFAGHQKQAPLFVATLSELARLMPDGTWLNEVEINGARVHIRGYSHGAADLIALIDRDPLFADAQFGAPLIRNPTGNVEQFDMLFDLRGKK
ncbi:MAG TPA: PilN domain-containing protein [Rhizomicrobium sp.]|jgi:general secretion pathway protein L